MLDNPFINTIILGTEDADAVVLETDGSFSVIQDLSNSNASALRDVKE